MLVELNFLGADETSLQEGMQAEARRGKVNEEEAAGGECQGICEAHELEHTSFSLHPFFTQGSSVYTFWIGLVEARVFLLSESVG